MKKSGQSRRVGQEVAPVGPVPDKVGWVRQFCGRGLFREIWKNRFLFLRGERLWVSAREVKDERGAQHLLDLSGFERCEELKKEKSRSKKSHSRFTLIRRSPTANTVQSLVFLALSPEEKESWIQALNASISRTKPRAKDPVLDQVALEDGALVHPTRERVRMPPGRRLPSRGHLLAVASLSQGCLSLDLVDEEDGSWDRDLQVDCRVVGGRQRAGTDVSKLRPSSRDTRVKTGSLPRASERHWGRGESSKALKNRNHMQVFKGQSRTPQPGKKLSSQGRNRCASMDEVLSSRPALIRSELRSALRRHPSEDPPPVGQLQSLIAQRMQRAQELLEEMRLQELQKTKNQRERPSHRNSPKTQNQSKTKSGGSGAPRVQAKDSPQNKSKKNKIKNHTEPAKTRDQTKSNQSPSLRDQTKSNQSPSLRDQTKSNQSPSLRGQTKSNQSPSLRDQTKSNQSPSLRDQTKSNQSSSLRDQTKSNQSPSLRDQTKSNQSPSLRDQTKSNQSPSLRDQTKSNQSSSLRDQTCFSGAESTLRSELQSESNLDRTLWSGPDGPEPGPNQRSGSEQSLESELGEEVQELHQDLEEVLEEESDQDPDQDLASDLDQAQGVEEQRAEAERLLQEALCSWRQAQEVLKEVRELQSQTLRRQRRKTYREQEPGQDQDPNLMPDKTQDQDSNLAPDKIQDQDPNLAPVKTQNQDPNLAPDKTQEQDPNLAKDKTQDQDSYRAQEKTQDPDPNLAQDDTQDQDPNMAQDKTQDRHQERDQDPSTSD